MNLLKESLIKLVYDYTINGKYADKKFAEQVITLFVNEKNLNGFVQKCNLDSTPNSSLLSSYDISSKTIYVDVKKELNHNLNRIISEGLYSTNFEKILKVNLSIINAIIHELTHAFQYKKCLTNTFDLETKLLEIALERNLYIIRSKEKEEQISDNMYNYLYMLESVASDEIYYISSPSERMANLTGLGFERDLAQELISPDSTNIGIYCDLRYLRGQQLGYNGFAPTAFIMTVNNNCKKSFGLKYDSVDIMKNVEECNKLSRRYRCSLDDKLYYGFPVSKKETIELEQKVLTLQKKLTD